MPENYTGTNAGMGSKKRGRDGPLSNYRPAKLMRSKGGFGPPMSVKNVNKIINTNLKRKNIAAPEQKYIELSGAVDISNVANGTVVLLNGMAEGDTELTRTGIKIRTTKMEFVATITMSPTAALGSDNGKVSLFVHRQANNAGTSFSLASGSGGLAPYWLGATPGYPLVKAAMQEDEYYIIKDFDYSLDAKAIGSSLIVGGVTTTTDWQADCQVLKCSVPISRVVQYNGGNAGTVADIIRNAFYLGFGGVQAAGVTATNMSYITRLWYTDM